MNLRKDHIEGNSVTSSCAPGAVPAVREGVGVPAGLPRPAAARPLPRVAANAGLVIARAASGTAEVVARFFCFFSTRGLRRESRRDLLYYRRSETTSNGGPLGSYFDEERSELRYVVRIAEFSESSSL